MLLRRLRTDINTNCFQNIYFKEGNNMAVEKTLIVTKNLFEKDPLKIFTWNKKHSSKQVAPINYTLEKNFFAAIIFDGLWMVSLLTE